MTQDCESTSYSPWGNSQIINEHIERTLHNIRSLESSIENTESEIETEEGKIAELESNLIDLNFNLVDLKEQLSIEYAELSDLRNRINSDDPRQ